MRKFLFICISDLCDFWWTFEKLQNGNKLMKARLMSSFWKFSKVFTGKINEKAQETKFPSLSSTFLSNWEFMKVKSDYGNTFSKTIAKQLIQSLIWNK